MSAVGSPGSVERRALLFVVLCVAPLAAFAKWSVVDKVTGVKGCNLRTEEISLFDGYQETRLRLSVANGELRVKTESNIDVSFNDVGLAVDGKEFIAADGVADEKQVLFQSSADAIIEQFIRGRSVTVYLRFWPSYPATQRYQARFSLIGFTRAYNDYKICSDKLS